MLLLLLWEGGVQDDLGPIRCSFDFWVFQFVGQVDQDFGSVFNQERLWNDIHDAQAQVPQTQIKVLSLDEDVSQGQPQVLERRQKKHRQLL